MATDHPHRPPTSAPPGEPVAGTEPGGPDRADDAAALDPGRAGDTADVVEHGQSAVTPVDPAAGGSTAG